jgi:hypothetical protein
MTPRLGISRGMAALAAAACAPARFTGKPTLSSAQWAQVDARVAEFGKYIS